MMAAATPRLLRALRAQRFRGPVWCCGVVRGAASGAGQAPPFSSLPPKTPENPEILGQNPEILGKNSEISSNSTQILGENPEILGKKSEILGNNPEILGKNPEILGKNPEISSNSSGILGENPGILGENGGILGEIAGILGEPRLVDLGLGGSTPVGMIQNLLERLHLDLGLPWWGAIAAGTVGARLLLLPLVLRGQREAARLSRHLPHLQRLSRRLAEARRGADPNQVAVAYAELASFQRRHDVNPLRGFLVPLVQTPLFVSFFLALQGMAAAPVPGFRGGGLLWFPDLASPDPLHLLPLLVTASTWLVLELGAETGVAAPGAGPVRQILRLLPLVFLPFIFHFPTAVFTYWLTSNSFSLLQTGLLRVPALRAKLGVAPPPTPPPAPPTGPAPAREKAGILRRLKEEWREAQATHEAEQRQWRLRNHLQLAAKGPLRQTLAQNPLRAPEASTKTPQETPKRPWKETLG